jgi:hypothetical protein
MNARAPVVAALFAVISTGASGQATGLPVSHRWIFDGAAFALDMGFDARDQASGSISVIAFTGGLARKPFAFTATLAYSDSAHGIAGGISAAVVARPNDWAALGAAQVDAGFSDFGGVRRIHVPVSVAIPFLACAGKRFALIIWGRGGMDAERVSRTGQTSTTSYLLGYGFGMDMELRNGLGFQLAFGGQVVRGPDPQRGALGLHFSTRPIPRVRPSSAGEGCRL